MKNINTKFNKFNESKSKEEELDRKYNKAVAMLEKITSFIGIKISEDNIITPTHQLGKLICKLATRQGHWEKIDDKSYKPKKS